MFAACLLLLPATARGEQDHALDRVPPIQSAASLQGGGDDKSVCHFGALGSSLSLHEAVSRALCNNPQTRQSWASIQVQASQVGVAKARYFPILSVDGELDRSSTDVSIRDKPQLDSYSRTIDKNASLGPVGC